MKLIIPLEKIMSHHEFFADWERELLNFLNFTYFHLIFTGVGLMEYLIFISYMASLSLKLFISTN